MHYGSRNARYCDASLLASECRGKAVLLSRRFDGATAHVLFLSVMSMTGSVTTNAGATWNSSTLLRATGRSESGRRSALSAHGLQRAGFECRRSPAKLLLVWLGRNGWSLSPAYDLNRTPTDVKARILSTNINLDEGTLLDCSCRERRGIFRTDAHCGAQRHPRSWRSGLALAGFRRRSRRQAS